MSSPEYIQRASDRGVHVPEEVEVHDTINRLTRESERFRFRNTDLAEFKKRVIDKHQRDSQHLETLSSPNDHISQYEAEVETVTQIKKLIQIFNRALERPQFLPFKDGRRIPVVRLDATVTWKFGGYSNHIKKKEAKRMVTFDYQDDFHIYDASRGNFVSVERKLDRPDRSLREYMTFSKYLLEAFKELISSSFELVQMDPNDQDRLLHDLARDTSWVE